MPDQRDFREMIAQAKAELRAAKVDPLMEAVEQIDPGIIEPANAEGVEVIARQLAAVKAQTAALKAVDARLTAALKLVAGTADGLRHGKTILATLSRTHPVSLNTDIIKELFPYEKYPQYYKPVTEVVTLRVDPHLKAAVYDDPRELTE